MNAAPVVDRGAIEASCLACRCNVIHWPKSLARDGRPILFDVLMRHGFTFVVIHQCPAIKRG